jgi:hypothetical protein
MRISRGYAAKTIKRKAKGNELAIISGKLRQKEGAATSLVSN